MTNDPLFAMTMRMCDAMFGPVESPPASVASAAGEPVEPKEWQPSAADLIGVIAADYGVSHDTAGRWLRDAFAPVPNSVQESL